MTLLSTQGGGGGGGGGGLKLLTQSDFRLHQCGLSQKI